MDIEPARRTSSAFGCFTIAFIVLVLLWLFLMVTGRWRAPWSHRVSVESGGDVAEAAASDSAAIAACHAQVSFSLGTPRDAFFIKPVGPFKHMAERVGERSFRVASIAILQGAGGKKLERPFDCTATYTGGGHWRIDRLDIMRPEQPPDYPY